MNAKKLGAAALLLVMGTGVGVAVAEPDGAWKARKAELVQKYDANKDGQLDDAERQALRQEMKAHRQAMRQEKLQRFDANKDGRLDDTERQVMRDEHVTERFKAMDSNGDGVLSLDEFKAGAPQRGFGRRGWHGRK
jgi:hypothetical protein